MTKLTELDITKWDAPISLDEQQKCIHDLENGGVIYFPNLSFPLAVSEEALLSPALVKGNRKNISYDYRTHQIKGCVEPALTPTLSEMMQRFSTLSRELVFKLFPSYRAALMQQRTSYRPVEVKSRKSSYRKDDTRLHVDAFPSQPNQGKRILRVFTNINPQGNHRVWRLGEHFTQVVQRHFSALRQPTPGVAKVMNALGLTKSYRTAYDHYMLQLHNRMKADEVYQKNVEQILVKFPANTTWIVFTDSVSHAAMSGQYILEQTFYLPHTAMQDVSCAPLKVLENFAQRTLV